MNNRKKYRKLYNWFEAKYLIFNDFKEDVYEYNNLWHRRIFIDRDSKILLLAHLDTVHAPQFYSIYDNTLYASGIDDRIGCWMSYNLSMELQTDLLLTDLEESGRSTGQHHILKNYNWIVEFDRRGSDFVLYQCGSKEWENALKEFYPDRGWGSFSDISFLETESCCANIGTGVRFEHSVNSEADLSITYGQIHKFRKFFKKYKDDKFIRDEQYSYYGNYHYDDYYDRNWLNNRTNKNKTGYLLKGDTVNNSTNPTYQTCVFCKQPITKHPRLILVGHEQWYICPDCYLILERDIDQSDGYIIDLGEEDVPCKEDTYCKEKHYYECYNCGHRSNIYVLFCPDCRELFFDVNDKPKELELNEETMVYE